jgi:hypothetical protein
MKKKAVILTAAIILIAVSIMTTCDNGTTPTKPDPDPYATFKADATERWESGTTVEKNEESDFLFITDTDGSLFESGKYTTGRMADDGSTFELIEFSCPSGNAPAVGTPASPSIRTASGSVSLHSLSIVKIDSGKLWIVFKETADAPERRIVQ